MQLSSLGLETKNDSCMILWSCINYRNVGKFLTCFYVFSASGARLKFCWLSPDVSGAERWNNIGTRNSRCCGASALAFENIGAWDAKGCWSLLVSTPDRKITFYHNVITWLLAMSFSNPRPTTPGALRRHPVSDAAQYTQRDPPHLQLPDLLLQRWRFRFSISHSVLQPGQLLHLLAESLFVDFAYPVGFLHWPVESGHMEESGLMGIKICSQRWDSIKRWSTGLSSNPHFHNL